MPTSEKPLSDSQERALIALVDHARSEGRERLWHDHRRLEIRERTVSALAGRGLVETDWTNWPRRALVRATDAGVALCDSMGD